MPVPVFPLLDEAACDDWVLRVSLLARHWRQRHADVPFYSLGLAAYLDAGAASASPYWDRPERDRSNRLLAAHFGALLQLVQDCLERHCALPALLAPEAAWPGFHIYLPHPAFAGPVASVHRDLQYRDVFAGRHFGAQDLLSFTLPLSVPAGSGLHLWRREDAQPDFIAYRHGQMIVHDGLALHQAVLACGQGGLERITLQGHAVRLDGQLLLYW